MKNSNITFISAGAGSGKTYRLTEILFDALQSGRAQASGIMATTFTRKAANELRERVCSKLLEEKAWPLAASMDAASIGTVNSVCGNLLTRFAFEAGISPKLQVIEEEQSAALLHQVMDEIIDDATRSELNEIAHRTEQLEEFLPTWPNEILALIQQARSNGIDADRLTAMGTANSDDFLSRLPQPRNQDWNTQLQQHIEAVLPSIEHIQQTAQQKNIGTLIDLYRKALHDLGLRRLTWSTWEKLGGAEGAARTRELTQAVRDLAKEHLAHPGLHHDLRRYIELLFITAAKIMAEFAAEKANQGLIDFTDQESLLLQILEHPEVEAVLRDELQLLLVDEFQDTSPIQLAIFSKLASMADETWWVGDLKQAIYGFRGSDPILMESVIAALPQLGGQLEVLDKSWRSRPALVDFVNHLFTPVFAPQASEQIRLSSARTEFIPDAAALAYWRLAGSNKEASMRSLAQAISEFLASGYRVVDKQTGLLCPATAKDIAVLSRSNEGVSTAAAALKAVGVPASAGLPRLLRTPEAVLALAALRRLNDETDTVATAEILSLAYSQEPETWLANRLQWLDEKDDLIKPGQWLETGDHLDPLLANLAVLRGQLCNASPTEALSMAISALDAARIILGWQRNEQIAQRRLANLDALQAFARQYEDECRSGQRAATVSGLLFWLKDMANSGKDLCATPDIDAVHVLTHHAAKGLEWPIVICLDLAADNRSRLWGLSMNAAVDFDFDKPLAGRSLRFWPWPYGQIKKTGLQAWIETSNEAKAARQAALREGQRLLYVSLTRARDLLVFAIPAKQKGNGEWLGSLGEHEYCLPGEKQWPIDEQRAIPYEMRECPEPGQTAEAFQSNAEETSKLYWFKPSKAGEYLPLIVNPSEAAPLQAKAGQVLKIAAPLRVLDQGNRIDLGVALHACFAASDSWSALSPHQVDVILKYHGVSAQLDVEEVIRYLREWRAWLSIQWKPLISMVEVPIQCALENGQRMDGQIDMLLKTSKGWILVDHKAVTGDVPDHNHLAEQYAGQIAAYSDAITRATGEKLNSCWLHLPLSGEMVEVLF